MLCWPSFITVALDICRVRTALRILDRSSCDLPFEQKDRNIAAGNDSICSTESIRSIYDLWYWCFGDSCTG